MKILRTIVKIIIFVLLLVLAINNMQSVEFNFLGIYNLKLPLIIILAIFAFGGLVLGMLFSFLSNLSLKSQISKLKKQVFQLETRSNKTDNRMTDNHII